MTPHRLLDPAGIRVGAIRQPADADAGREQSRRLLVLTEANGQVRDPDDDLGEHGCEPRLGRRLPGRDAVGTGLAEIAGQISEHVVKFRADVRQLRVVAQEGGRDTKLTAGFLVVAAPAGELRLGQRQLDQRIRPGDTVGAPLGLGEGGRARVPIAVQPVNLGLAGPQPDDVLGGADLGDDGDRLFIKLARAGEVAALGDLLRQLGQRERNPEPFAERPELGQRQLQLGLPIPAAPGRA